MTTPDLNSEGGNMVSQRQVGEPRADEGGVSQSQPIIGSVPLPTREAEEPAAFDTSGVVTIPSGPHAGDWTWERVGRESGLLTQGYIEALFASEGMRLRHLGEAWKHKLAAGFSDLAPETLARIITDCTRMTGDLRLPNHENTGRDCWNARQAGRMVSFPPLAPYLSEDGLIRLSTEASPLGAEPGSTGIVQGRDEQITQPSHDDEGLIERLIERATLVLMEIGYPTPKAVLIADLISAQRQAANTISRLKGELGKAEFIIADTGAMLDHFDGLGVANDRPDSRAFSDRIEDIALRSLQLEAEIKELREALEPFSKAHDQRPDINDSHPDYDRENLWESPAATTLTYGDLRKARSLLSPSQDVGFSSARSSRDARSSTRPEGPCSDEGER